MADDRRTINSLVFFSSFSFASVYNVVTLTRKKSILASLDFLLYATVAEREQARGYYLLTSRQF